ncbi:MAG TPA: lipopolysaccharide transport periplasmic protein LptA [Smithella sp.]|nr:lipopolysaccharide transport periplasmic protein LptA [Smithella sp.]
MINKKVHIVFLFVLLSAFSEAYADQNILGTKQDKPLEITSHRMEAFQDRKLIVFSGDATVTQGNSVLKADKLLLYYKKDPDKIINGKADSDKTGKLEKIEARGHVSLVQENRKATGNEAVYFQEGNKVILTGNAVLNEGKSSIKGERVIILIDENRGIVESGEQTKVKAVIYPQDRKTMESNKK